MLSRVGFVLVVMNYVLSGCLLEITAKDNINSDTLLKLIGYENMMQNLNSAF